MQGKADNRQLPPAFPNLPDSLLAFSSGPAAHLGHKVLVSQERTAKRLKPQNRKPEQLVLPTTPALSPRRLANLGSLRLAESGSSSLMVLLSARETRRDGMLKGLMRERKAPPPPLAKDDGERALQELQATGDPEFQLPTDGTLFPFADSIKTPSATPQTEQAWTPWTPLPKEEGYFTLPQTPLEARQESLKQCFRSSMEEIKEAHAEACKWNVLPELESEPQINRQAKTLQTLWEDANLPGGLRESEILGSDPRETLEADAHSAEITASISYLNFVRWLCGLPKVDLSSSKQVACSILCQALLPRSGKVVAKPRTEETKPKPKPSPKSAALRFVVPSVQLAQELNELKNGVFILQGEGSLVSALEDAFGALHLCHPDIGETYEAAEIAQQLCAGADYVPPSIAVSPLIPRMSAASHATNREEFFPHALRHLKVFWHLDTTCTVPKTPLSPSRRARPKATRRNKQPKQAELFGLDSIWGDRKGFLASRRALLSPKLQSFAAARSDDTCVLWLMPDGNLEKWEDAIGGKVTNLQASGVHAVCYPPPGYVPLSLMEGPNMPWTVMPDALRFQPTSSISVRVFQVCIERHQKPTAVRLREVRVKYMSVDCNGESFCIIFWPDLGHVQPGLQLEVEVSGLRGEEEQLTMFHEFITFRRKDGDHALLSEAAHFRETVYQAEPLWVHGGLKEASAEDHGQIEPLSHLSREILVESNDLVLTLRCVAASLWATLMVKRFDGEFTEVERACHSIKLRDDIFLVRVKLPLPRHYYELKFSISSVESPREIQPSTLQYFVNTSGKCPAIVRSLDDQMMEKYGFVKVQIENQLNGITIISPCKFRVPVGQTYFLMHVDRSIALQAARDALPPVVSASKKKETAGLAYTSLFDERLRPSKDFRSPKEVRMMQDALQGEISKNIQETYGDIHLDLMLHNGRHIQRLRERQDLPGLFEGLVTISDIDVSTKIQLVIRFPKIHACDFSPRRVAEWIVSRSQERVHENF